eukprot:TRINITY_DN1062_c0_g1_i4.p1 TRINITY_DN1062_c0_g1~~TRINITY_DN1062_c0_g1_i4.p1  ORF type:complete len:166 (-),score=19.92 TRINITY_DN1062_c0_g1_i4:229-726(-)
MSRITANLDVNLMINLRDKTLILVDFILGQRCDTLQHVLVSDISMEIVNGELWISWGVRKEKAQWLPSPRVGYGKGVITGHSARKGTSTQWMDSDRFQSPNGQMSRAGYEGMRVWIGWVENSSSTDLYVHTSLNKNDNTGFLTSCRSKEEQRNYRIGLDEMPDLL